MYVYMCICISVYMYICIYVYMYICIYVYMYICVYVYMYIFPRCRLCIVSNTQNLRTGKGRVKLLGLYVALNSLIMSSDKVKIPSTFPESTAF